MPDPNALITSIIQSVLTSIAGIIADMGTAITGVLACLIIAFGLKSLANILDADRYSQQYGINNLEEGREYDAYKAKRDRRAKFDQIYRDGK